MVSKYINPYYQIDYDKGKRIVKELKLPINFNLILTNECNADCIHCCANANNTKDNIPLKNFKDILKIAKKYNIFYFVITGGEPLLYRDFWRLLRLLNNKFGIIINTNGTLIDKYVAKKLSKYNIANVHVSLDAPNERIYEKQRGKNTKLLDVIKGIKNLVKNKIKVTTKLIITNINKDYIKDIIRLSISLGVKEINLAWFKPSGRGLRNEKSLIINPKDVKKVILNLLYLKEKYKRIIRINFDNAQIFPFLIKKSKKIKYRKLCGDYFCRVDHKGDIFPCPFLEIKIGNVFNDDLEKLWNSNKLIKLRKLSWGKNLSGGCQECKYKDICAGGCRARALVTYKDINKKDPLCWFKK